MPAGQVEAYRRRPVLGSKAPGVPMTSRWTSPRASPAAFTAPSRASVTWRTTGCAGCRTRGGQLVLAHGAAGDIGDGGEDALGRDIQARRVGGPRIDGVQLGVGARPPLARAGGQHESGGLQPGEELGGGGLGQPGQLSDPGPRERSVREQQIEGGAVVHGAQDARGARRTGGSCHVCRHLPFNCPVAQLPRVAVGKSTARSLLGKFPIGGRKVGRGPWRRQEKPPPRQQSRYLRGRSPGLVRSVELGEGRVAARCCRVGRGSAVG